MGCHCLLRPRNLPERVLFAFIGVCKLPSRGMTMESQQGLDSQGSMWISPQHPPDHMQQTFLPRTPPLMALTVNLTTKLSSALLSISRKENGPTEAQKHSREIPSSKTRLLPLPVAAPGLRPHLRRVILCLLSFLALL